MYGKEVCEGNMYGKDRREKSERNMVKNFTRKTRKKKKERKVNA